jgi:hypothetical protein
VEKYINDKIPTSIADQGHALSKHGDDPASIQKGIGKLKDGGSSFSHYDDNAKAADAVKNAPDALKDYLRNNPSEVNRFQQFMQNDGTNVLGPSGKPVKPEFGFTYDTGKPLGNTYSMNGGKVTPGPTPTSAQITYNKVQAPGGGANAPFDSPAVKSTYPKVTDPAAGAGGPSALGRLGTIAEKGGGALALGGGAVQGYQGIQELRNGDTLNGTTDTAGGALNMVGGAGLLLGGAASTVAAPVALGGAAILDGGRDVIQGIQSGDNEKIAVGGAKGLGGTLMAAGGITAATGFGAPLGAGLALAGGAIYAGASIYENRAAIGNAIGGAASSTGHWIASWF